MTLESVGVDEGSTALKNAATDPEPDVVAGSVRLPVMLTPPGPAETPENVVVEGCVPATRLELDEVGKPALLDGTLELPPVHAGKTASVRTSKAIRRTATPPKPFSDSQGRGRSYF